MKADEKGDHRRYELTREERARLVDLHIEQMMERKAEAERNLAIARVLGPMLRKLKEG